MSAFKDSLIRQWAEQRFICLGLDPSISKLPESLQRNGAAGIVEFNTAIVAATADLVAAYKPQSAYYERLGTDGPHVLAATIAAIREHAPDVPVILDAKRGDIGSTNDAYVETVFDVYGADAVTVAPYLGPEAMEPFFARADKGVIVLCRTSNPGAGRYQNLQIDGEPLHIHIARDVANTWNVNDNCALVVGATAPGELAAVRSAAPELPILVPGIGAQGGDLRATIGAGTRDGELPLLISSSRELIYAFAKQSTVDFAQATRNATMELNDAISKARSVV